MKKAFIFWGIAGIFTLLATGVYLKNSGLRGYGDFLLANVEALTQDEKPEPPKMGYRIVSYILEPPCYVAFPDLVRPIRPNSLRERLRCVCMSRGENLPDVRIV